MCSAIAVVAPSSCGGCGAGLAKGRGQKAESGSMATGPSPRLIGRLESSVVEYKNLRFLITERPSESSMDTYISEVEQYEAKYVVRVGGTTYNTDKLLSHGIQVLDLPFPDGTAPSLDIIVTWCQLLRSRRLDDTTFCVAVHCVAGLGRAPVLVAIALIELGMRYDDAVLLIRQKRHGAINTKQLDFLSKYRPKSRLSTSKTKGCEIM